MYMVLRGSARAALEFAGETLEVPIMDEDPLATSNHASDWGASIASCTLEEAQGAVDAGEACFLSLEDRGKRYRVYIDPGLAAIV
jgi:hypothetical protein